jgi:hypothetical protein
MTFKYELQIAIMAVNHGVPVLMQHEALSADIIKLIEKRIDECKTIEEFKEMLKE